MGGPEFITKDIGLRLGAAVCIDILKVHYGRTSFPGSKKFLSDDDAAATAVAKNDIPLNVDYIKSPSLDTSGLTPARAKVVDILRKALQSDHALLVSLSSPLTTPTPSQPSTPNPPQEQPQSPDPEILIPPPLPVAPAGAKRTVRCEVSFREYTRKFEDAGPDAHCDNILLRLEAKVLRNGLLGVTLNPLYKVLPAWMKDGCDDEDIFVCAAWPDELLRQDGTRLFKPQQLLWTVGDNGQRFADRTTDLITVIPYYNYTEVEDCISDRFLSGVRNYMRLGEVPVRLPIAVAKIKPYDLKRTLDRAAENWDSNWDTASEYANSDPDFESSSDDSSDDSDEDNTPATEAPLFSPARKRKQKEQKPSREDRDIEAMKYVQKTLKDNRYCDAVRNMEPKQSPIPIPHLIKVAQSLGRLAYMSKKELRKDGLPTGRITLKVLGRYMHRQPEWVSYAVDAYSLQCRLGAGGRRFNSAVAEVMSGDNPKEYATKKWLEKLEEAWARMDTADQTAKKKVPHKPRRVTRPGPKRMKK